MSTRSLSLDQFIALNEEMAALVRAGVPLDRGLIELGRDVRGSLGAIAADVGARLERGEPLERIVADENGPFPPLYRAVIVGGLQAGRLAAAFEGLATTIRRVREMRRIVGIAVLYPLFVLILAVCLFALVARHWAPTVAEAYGQWQVSGGEFVAAVSWLGERAAWWAPSFALLLLIAFLLWWIVSGRVARARVSGRFYLREWLPTLGRLSKAGRMASFTDVLRLLIEHRVPLPQALVLAGEASGDRRLESSARRIAENLERGAPCDSERLKGFPPLLAWLLAGGAPESQLTSALEHLTRSYRHEALRLGQWLSVYLPLLMTGAIGGSAVFAYALAVLGPVFALLKAMGNP